MSHDLCADGFVATALSPHPSRRLRDLPELRLLVLDRQFVADDRGGKPALGTESKAVFAHVARRLFDAADDDGQVPSHRD